MTKHTPLPSETGTIEIRGARQNNLRGFDLSIPLGKLIVVSGPSGSGKSSLAFDTLYAEGQRRYVETFSPYTRQFFDRMDKPAVDEIRGIPPAIAIEQVNAVKSTRSTVGTMTDLNDYLRLLLPRVVDAFCPKCSSQIRPATIQSIVQSISKESTSAVLITFPMNVPHGAEVSDFLGFLQAQGYQRVWAEGDVIRVDEAPAMLPDKVYVIQDRVTPSRENAARLSEAIETALRFGKGKINVIDGGKIRAFALGWHCVACEADIPEPNVGRFSFNHPVGACGTCRGFGRIITLEMMRAIPNTGLSLADGAIKPFQTESGQECQDDLMRAAAKRKIKTNVPFEKLSKAHQHWVIYGDDDSRPSMDLWKAGLWYGVRGFFDWLESRSYKMHVRVLLSRYRSYTLCPDCKGGRFAPDSLNFRWGGHTAPELLNMSVDLLHEMVRGEQIKHKATCKDSTTLLLLDEVETRLGYLLEVGLGYLTLDRPTRSLSGGETARVNLTTCLGTSLVNTLFVLDEPSIGLHPRDTQRLLGVMRRLRDRGNTLVVVEHEEAVIRAADHLVEIGPGRGELGGSLMHSGPLEGILSGKIKTLTGDYLTGAKAFPEMSKRRKPAGWIRISGATENNLKDVTVDFPLGVFACVTGVSGSGKSTLVHQVLYRNLATIKGEQLEDAPGACTKIDGAKQIGSVVLVDQSPLSKTPRSSPALYLGIFDVIRQRFASLPEALSLGLTASAFSFNTGPGRCERCGGSGFEKIEMQFLSDVFVRCPECEGRRYQAHIRKISLGGISIDQVLDLTVTEAVSYAQTHALKEMVAPLNALIELGLGYLKLGQPLNGLSGGESQRLKLVERLLHRSEAKACLILDEPTTGLHFDDIVLLVRALNRLVDQGHSVIVIEHNLDVIRASDYLIDMGPEAGVNGGFVVATGTPEKVAECETSHTGRFLKDGRAKWNVGAAKQEKAKARAYQPGIEIVGARQHNLKNVSLQIPLNAMSVITGLSGSGKSSLAFDLLFAEGQRRFLDSMSPYARQFATQLERPDVDRVTGLPPTVAIEQRLTRGGGKSTVATVTEVYHFLRLLFSKVGVQHCPKCDVPVVSQTLGEAVRRAEALAAKGRLRVLAPLVKARKGFHTEVFAWAVAKGFKELLIDGKWETASKPPKLERFREHTIEVLVGEPTKASGMRELVAQAFEIGRGTALLLDSRNKRHVLSMERSCPDCGQSFEELDPRLFSFNSPHGWCAECHGFGEIWKRHENPKLDTALELELDYERQHEALESGEAECCEGCAGSRLNPTARAVRVAGTPLDAIVSQSASGVMEWLHSLKFAGAEATIAADVVPEIRQRLRFLDSVGLGYLSLNRSAKTLSGGESQRIRLAAQLGSNLRGVLYVLDEPTIGLHPRDNVALLDTLDALKKKGNALVIVEHDEDTLLRADHVIDLGPGAGRHGGRVVAQGTLESLKEAEESVTGKCLREPLQHPMRGERRAVESDKEVRWLTLSGASLHNVRKLDLKIPIGRLSVFTGISGSGKSTIMRGLLKPAVQGALASKLKGGAMKLRDGAMLRGAEHIEAVYEVDQSPIGKTSRSTPATYLGVFDHIRALFASTPLARIRGYEAGRFSFNSQGGRCEACLGQGMLKIEMNFLPPAHVRCPDCDGSRYALSTLEVHYQGRSIADVMAMPMDEAVEFFGVHAAIARPLRLLCETGLGYLTLGQASQTLSGGEAQRLKLVSELVRGIGRSEHKRIRKGVESRSVLYLLEEPTIGLHMADVRHLLAVLHRLVDAGHTVVVIEHHTSVIAEADHLIEVGPEAGAAGGLVIAAGTPEKVARERVSRIAPFLKPLLVSKARSVVAKKKKARSS